MGMGTASAQNNASLMQSYYFYSALLALKLLTLSSPLPSIMCNSVNVRRVNLSDLKQLAPFWLIAALYTTISPDKQLALALFRAFAVARFITAVGYLTKIPHCLDEAAFCVSFAITSFMGLSVVYAYKEAF